MCALFVILGEIVRSVVPWRSGSAYRFRTQGLWVRFPHVSQMPLERKATGSHLIKSHFPRKTQSPVSGFCYARNRVCDAVVVQCTLNSFRHRNNPWPSGRELALCAVGRGSIPGRVIPKT